MRVYQVVLRRAMRDGQRVRQFRLSARRHVRQRVRRPVPVRLRRGVLRRLLSVRQRVPVVAVPERRPVHGRAGRPILVPLSARLPRRRLPPLRPVRQLSVPPRRPMYRPLRLHLQVRVPVRQSEEMPNDLEQNTYMYLGHCELP